MSIKNKSRNIIFYYLVALPFLLLAIQISIYYNSNYEFQKNNQNEIKTLSTNFLVETTSPNQNELKSFENFYNFYSIEIQFYWYSHLNEIPIEINKQISMQRPANIAGPAPPTISS